MCRHMHWGSMGVNYMVRSEERVCLQENEL